jgi:hypothetical protein
MIRYNDILAKGLESASKKEEITIVAKKVPREIGEHRPESKTSLGRSSERAGCQQTYVW